jgi:ABC-2 type transport system ATP-binding protein
MELTISSISKRYNKEKYGLKDFSLTIENGILGLLGPNGAGKSTLLKIIATISRPTIGSIRLDGHDLLTDPNYIRKTLGYLPQEFGVYNNLNAFEFMYYIAAMKGVGGPGLKKRVESLLEGVNLIEAAKFPIGTYSGGMKQRVGIAQALLNDPKVLILDEPTVGLDPEERMRFRNLISDFAQHSIVILSSHIVSDIESIADKICIMKDGTLIAKGLQHEVIKTAEGKIFETVIDVALLPHFKLRHQIVNISHQKDGVRVRYISETTIGNSEIAIATLEDAYLFLTHNHI